ncbi:MAG: YfiT family bacillithiol transferase [Bacteroidia bacterium]
MQKISDDLTLTLSEYIYRKNIIMEDIEQLKYPIGKFQAPLQFNAEAITSAINYLSTYPQLVKDTVKDLTAEQLATPYRPGGWTVKQLLHHIPDSHANAYIRFKLALTEDTPTIKPYLEAKWAELNDSKVTDINVSLNLLDAVHQRWMNVMKGMSNDDFGRKFFHPEQQKEMTLWSALALYHWHGMHHHAHIANLIKRNNW